MKILAIDGNSIINRAFYGIRLLSNKSGQHTNAVYGFINILLKLTEQEKPDGVAVAFDLKAPTFRHKMYDGYKKGRKPMPDELFEQFAPLKRWLTLSGYRSIECEGYEADDILGTLADIADKTGNECVIATGDRDSLQLVSDKTRVLLAATKAGRPEITDYTVEKLKETYGLAPPQMIELKALMGDSSDNIPGIAGIGPKTATDLITKYGTVDYIYENLDSLEIKDTLKAKLLSGKESAFLSRTLGTICRTAPIDRNPESYLSTAPDKAELSALMTELELFSLMKRLELSPVSVKNDTENKLPSKKYKTVPFIEIKSEAEFDIYGGFAVSGSSVAELSGNELSSLLADKTREKRVYDLKKLLHEYGDVSGVCFDLTLAAYVANPSSKDYSVERLAAEYDVSAPVIEADGDAVKTAALFSVVCDAVKRELEKTSQYELLKNIELPLSRVLYEMEKHGFLVDAEGLKAEGEALEKQIADIENDIFSLADAKFNLNSPKQLGEVLFEKLGLPAKKKTKNGYSTGAEVLEELRYDFPIVELILKYRRLSKLKSTYCDGLLAAVAEDGRIHTTFNQTETRTGRISSLEPNLQNIPVRTEEGKKLRAFFKAPDGYTLCDADYSQIELRVLASIADDPVMIDAFKSGTDIHTVTASQVFGLPIDMVLPIMRTRAKAVNFGIVYGIGAFSLGKDIGVSRAEADKYIKGYLNTYKGVADYMNKVIEQAKKDGYVTTLFGRRRYLPEIREKNGMLRAFGERVARNAPIQGTAADIIKIAMVKVNERLKAECPEARLILQVHDELIVECPEEKAKTVCKILETEMENAAKLKVRLEVEAHFGNTWLIAKG